MKMMNVMHEAEGSAGFLPLRGENLLAALAHLYLELGLPEMAAVRAAMADVPCLARATARRPAFL